MNYNTLKKKVKNLKERNQINKALRITYKELYESAIIELRFKNLQVLNLRTELDQLSVFTTDILVKKAIELIIKRFDLDIAIHYRNVTGDNLKGFNQQNEKN